MELWDFVFVVFWVFDVVPDLETVNFKVLSRNDQYEIREVEVWIHYFDMLSTLLLILVIISIWFWECYAK